MISKLSNIFNKYKETRLNQKLIDAAAYGKTNKVIALIEKGANVNARDNREDWKRWTPLHWAASCAQTETVETLIEAGADLNAKDTNGMTPLDWAQMHLVESTQKALRDAASSSGETNSFRHARKVKAARVATRMRRP